MAQLIPSTIPVRVFEDHEARVSAVAVFSDKRRMVTCSYDATLRLWDLTTGVVLKKMEGHHSRVRALAVSRDGQFIASGDTNGELFAWDGETGEPITQAISAHTGCISSLDFSSDGKVLASGSLDSTTTLWNTSTWKLEGDAINCGTSVRCVRYFPAPLYSYSHQHLQLAIATEHNICIYHAGYDDWDYNSYLRNRDNYSYYGHYSNNSYNNPKTKADFSSSFQVQYQTTINTSTSQGSHNCSLAWTPDGSLLTGGDHQDPTIRQWYPNSSTWTQYREPWSGHFKSICAIALNSSGTLLASASNDNHVRLWRLSDRRTIAVFKHSGEVNCVTFSADGRHILSGGVDKRISQWPASEDALPKDGSKDGSLMKEYVTHQAQVYFDFKVLAIKTTVRNACIAGDFPTAEKVLNAEIGDGLDEHTSYAHRSFVMARKCNWDRALHDAIQSVGIQPSLAGHISKGIALCGKKRIRLARTSFDFASMFTNGDLKTDHFLFFIKTIALFNANEHDEAMLRVGELATCPNADPIACRVVEAYLRVQLGNIALDGARHNVAVDHFTAAVDASTFFYKLEIHSMYEEFVVLFGWDLKSLWQTANQQHCCALFQAGRIGAATESYQSMMEKSDEATHVSLCAWFTALKLQ